METLGIDLIEFSLVENEYMITEIEEISVFDKGTWSSAFIDEKIIYCAYHLQKLAGAFILDIDDTDSNYFTLSIIEVFLGFRGRNLGKILIAFSYYTSKNYLLADYSDKLIKIESKNRNTNRYYENQIHLNLIEGTDDLYVIDKETGDKLIDTYLRKG